MDIPNDYFDDHFLVGVYQTPGKTVEESKEDFKNYAQKNDLEVHPNFLVDKEGVFYVLLRGARYKLDAIGDYAYTFCVRAAEKSLTQQLTTNLNRRLSLFGGSSLDFYFLFELVRSSSDGSCHKNRF